MYRKIAVVPPLPVMIAKCEQPARLSAKRAPSCATVVCIGSCFVSHAVLQETARRRVGSSTDAAGPRRPTFAAVGRFRRTAFVPSVHLVLAAVEIARTHAAAGETAEAAVVALGQANYPGQRALAAAPHGLTFGPVSFGTHRQTVPTGNCAMLPTIVLSKQIHGVAAPGHLLVAGQA